MDHPRKRSGELQHSKELLAEWYQKIFDTALVGIAIANSDGKFKHCNPTFCELVGYSEVELYDQSFAQLFHPEDREENLREIERLKKGEISHFQIENRYLHKSGKVVWVRKYVTALPGESEFLAYFVVFSADTTEKRRADLALRESEQKYTALFQRSPSALALLDLPDGKLTEVNTAFSELFGLKGEELKGKTLVEAGVLDTLSEKDVSDAYSRVGYVRNYEVIYPCKSDEKRFLSLSLESIAIESQKYTLVTIVDVSDLKRAIDEKVQSESASRAKSEFLANMSHEIRTPLSAIVGFSALMSNPSLSKQNKEAYASRIHHNAKHLKALIDDILDLSKIESSKMEPNKTIFPLQRALEEEFDSHRSRAANKGLEFKVSTLTKIPEVLFTDLTWLRRILGNIIGNAIKYTDMGSIEIKISTARSCPTLTKDNLLEIVVQDSGIGMTDEQKRRIFEPFVQGDTGISHKFGGTGLGLIISKKLAQSLGGDVRLISSEKNAGSCFSILLDISLPAQGEMNEICPHSSVQMAEDSSHVRERFSGLKILVVEDSADLRLLYAEYFKLLGGDLQFAEDGQRGLELILANEFDVVLMDVQLPKMSGDRVVEVLRKSGNTTAVIALTACALKEDREKYLEIGFSDYLSKPFSLEDLARVIEKNSHDMSPT